VVSVGLGKAHISALGGMKRDAKKKKKNEYHVGYLQEKRLDWRGRTARQGSFRREKKIEGDRAHRERMKT